MHIPRTRIKKDIVCEFLPPHRRSQRAVILCGGMPGYTAGSRNGLMEFFSRRGYWVFLPRYRGTWESGGQFLKHSPHEDVIDVIDVLSRGFSDLWTGRRFSLKRPEIFLIGGSFGGAAVILASRDRRVKKAVALSPVIDWRAEAYDEPMGKLGNYLRAAFGEVYRYRERDWKRLARGEFFNPINETDSIHGRKLFIIHAKDDKVVPFWPTPRFAEATGSKLLALSRGGHFGVSDVVITELWRSVKRFLVS